MIGGYVKAGKSKLENYLNTILLNGNIVKCEMCGWNGIKFPKGRCPCCKSLPRTRLIHFSISHFDIPTTNVNILHVAPNKSEYNFINNYFSFNRYDRLDIRKYDHINIVRDIKDTNLDTSTYDLILLWHVLEHIPDDIKAIKEMRRILKPGGHVLISVPIYPNNNAETYEDPSIERKDFLEIHGHDDHCRSCGFDYYKRFEHLGFFTKTLVVNQFEEGLIKKYGLSKRHRAWLFKKNRSQAKRL